MTLLSPLTNPIDERVEEPAKEPAKRWRNRWTTTAPHWCRVSGSIRSVSPGEEWWGSRSFPSKDAAETAAQEDKLHNDRIKPGCVWLGAFPDPVQP